MPTINPKSLTIVIPTRERCDTLLYSIKTCVAQNYENLSILIVDNFSQDDTAEVVKSISDRRIQYVNSGRRLSMSANWEFALSHVKSDYVMFLGDDDGVLPGAVSDLMSLVNNIEPADAITWPSVEYGWPSCQNQNLCNAMVIPLTDGIETRHSADVLSDVINFRRPYNELPFIYKGLVKIDVVIKLRAASGGTLFHSMIPDIYFGISSCAVIGHYLHSFRPYTLNGASSHSNGTASFSGAEVKAAELKFLSEDNIPFHPSLPFCPSIPILITESLIQARTRLPGLNKYSVNMDTTVKAAITQIARSEANTFSSVVDALNIISQKNQLQPETIQAIAACSNRPIFSAKRIYGTDIINKRYIVNCDEFDVKDCFTASILASFILSLNKNKQLSARQAIQNSARLVIREITKRTGWLQ
jgi:glycosyltransferase involved in cell wall biosynthesis